MAMATPSNCQHSHVALLLSLENRELRPRQECRLDALAWAPDEYVRYYPMPQSALLQTMTVISFCILQGHANVFIKRRDSK